jgi:phage-related baseplate assembly protein
LSVYDDQGHQYYQVDYLSQNVLYKEVANRTGNSTNQVASILKPFVVPRRFVLEQEGNSAYLQFGYGSDSEITSDSVAEPSNLVLDKSGRTYISDTSFDPSKLLDTDKFGVGPSDTNLIITYRVNTTSTANASAGSLKRVTRAIVDFADSSKIETSIANRVRSSFEAYNYEPIVGGISNPDTTEIRRRAGDFFATQNRAVTSKDYESLVYAMPSQFGGIKRCKVLKDSDSFKRNLNLYILAENSNGTLAKATTLLKENLKVWVDKVKMANDTVDILDGRIVNFGIKYALISDPEFNKYDVLSRATSAIASYYTQPRYFGEPLYVTDIYSMLNKLDGVVDVYNVEFIRKVGGSYSDTTYSFRENMSADARYLNVPDNVCMEMKFPSNDIAGAVK